MPRLQRHVIRILWMVGPARCCPPRHRTAFGPSRLELIGILWRGEQSPAGPRGWCPSTPWTAGSRCASKRQGAHSVPVYPCTLATSSSVAWPLTSVPLHLCLVSGPHLSLVNDKKLFVDSKRPLEEATIYFDTIRECYEAYVIYNFYTYCTAGAGHSSTSRLNLSRFCY